MFGLPKLRCENGLCKPISIKCESSKTENLESSSCYGVLNPKINTPFIELSTTAYLFALSLLVSSWNSISYPRSARASKLNHLQWPSPKYMKIELCHFITTPQKTPRMVVRWWWDIPVPGNWYSQVHRNEKPPGKCGLNGTLPNEQEDRRNTQQSVAVHTRQVYNDVEAYKGQSQAFMRAVIVNR